MTITTECLPRWASDILSAAPRRGEGLNVWLLRASIALRRCGRTEDEIRRVLHALTTDERIRAGEIERAVKRSAEYIAADHGARRPASQWSAIDKQLRARVIADAGGFGVVDLWEGSSYRFADAEPHTEKIIDALFPHNPLVCAAGALETANTAPRESFRGRLANSQFIVPSAMAAPTGLTQDGRVSARCLGNTGPRQYLVVEQDSGNPDEQAAVIAHLADRAPLVLVVHSGGKSLHAWFTCAGQPEDIVRRFFEYAVKLGADRATWTRCQLVRMPDGARRRPDGTTARQSALYFNPNIMEVIS